MDDKIEQNKKLAEQQGPSGKELYEFQKKQKEEIKKKEQRKETLAEAPRKIGKYLFYGAIGVAIIGALSWFIATSPSIPKEEILSRSGLHWHPELIIFVKGEKQEIPTNIGIGAIHQPIHTHDTTGVIHLEFQGLVRKQDIALGQFFKIWDKDMRSFGSNMKMTVNSEVNTEYENYIMRDQDKIELRFDK